MAAQELKLRVLFDLIDRATKPLQAILQGNRQLAKSFKTSHDRLKELGRAQQEIASFRTLRAGMRETATVFTTARQRLTALSDRMQATATPTRAMARKFSQASL